jgi:hypothetical protein
MKVIILFPQTCSVEEAMSELTKRTKIIQKSKKTLTSQQPLIFKVHEKLFVKADNTAICVVDASCFADVVEFLFMCFYVFNVQYPSELRLFYSAFERMIKLKSSVGRSIILDDFFKKTRETPCLCCCNCVNNQDGDN